MLFVESDKMEEDAEEEGREDFGIKTVVVLFHLFHLVGILKDGMLINLEVVATDDGKDEFHVVIIHVLDDAADLIFIGGRDGLLRKWRGGEDIIVDHVEQWKRGAERRGGMVDGCNRHNFKFCNYIILYLYYYFYIKNIK